jgi:hypothetical protein
MPADYDVYIGWLDMLSGWIFWLCWLAILAMLYGWLNWICWLAILAMFLVYVGYAGYPGRLY